MEKVQMRILLWTIFLIAAVLVVPATVAASTTGWWYVHGTAANFENNVGIAGVNRLPGAYEVGLLPGASNAIQVAIPTNYAGNVAIDTIFARFSTDSPVMFVTNIEVYNGSVLVANIIGPWAGAPVSLAPLLGSKMKFNRGLMLRIKMFNGDPAVTHRVKLMYVGARFVVFP